MTAGPRRARLGPCVLLAVGLAGCGLSDADVAARREAVAREAAEAVRRDLEDGLARTHGALGDLDGVLSALPSSDGPRFDAMLDLRIRWRVDGISWEGPGGETWWSGRALEPVTLPAPPPWDGSFRSGDVTWHDGPFLRALVVGPTSVRGGYAGATVVLEERAPADVSPPFERRWLKRHGVHSVEILAPDAPPPAEAGVAAALVRAPSGAPVLAVRVRAPGLEAVRERMEGERTGLGGLGLLLGIAGALAVAGVLLRRRARPAWRRGAGVAALALATREALRLVDLPGRFPALRPAFRASDFGVDTLLGWLASPGDFALSALALVVVATALAAAARGLPEPRGRGARAASAGLGTLAAAGVGVGWLRLVDLAAQAPTPYFAATSFVPPLPAALMLGGLVAHTAAGWMLARSALRVAARALPGARPLLTEAGLAAAAGAAAWVAAAPPEIAWGAALLPASSALFLGGGAPGTGTPRPARVLLVSVLATGLLFPIVWARVGTHRTMDLPAVLDAVVRREATAALSARADLETLGQDAWLREGLRRAREGTPPPALAFHVWLRSFLSAPGAHGIVTVLDDRERILDQFSLVPLPTGRVPPPAFPAEGAGPIEVLRARGERDVVRSVVGRLRLADATGATLGGVVMTVPDPLDLEIAGLGALVEGVLGVASAADAGRFPLQFAVLERGAVTAASDPGLSHLPGAFGPAGIADLGPGRPEVSWRDDDEEGHAEWSEDRGAAIAVRRRTADAGDALLALARLVVVGVALGVLAACALLLAGVRSYRPRLHHRILLSYFAISVVPLALLGWATAAEARSRYEQGLAQRLQRDLGRVRSDLEGMGPLLFDTARDANLTRWALQRGHDVLLYRDGVVAASSRSGLVQAELLPARLPAEAWRAAALERREIIRREASFVGRNVWFGYAPVLDDRDRAVAVIGVPLLYDRDRIEEELAVTGSALLAAYLLTVVLVLVGGIYAAGRIARPIDDLSEGTRLVAEGDLDVELPGEGRDELGQLVAAFNQMTRDLRTAAEQAARVERESAWRRMARQIAHEIKNPLTPMRLMIQQLQADVARDPARAPDAVQRTASVVLRQIEALGRIAADFAQFARTPRRAAKDVDVAALVTEVAHLYSGSAAQGITVAADAPPDLPTVRWDEEELRRVLVNLVGNAVQSIRGEGRVEIRARAETRRHRSGVRVEVADTGVGIPRENLERLFEPGFSTKTAGTGLGLAIVRGILDDMGGSVEVESRTGLGSTFRVWWPCDAESSPS